MKIYKSISCLLLLISSWAHSQKVASGWAIENIHGPSQVGIVDTIPVDLNKDGLMDVVSASIEDGHLRAYINQGNLEFEQQYISTDVLGVFRVVATDFNNDGEVDFLIPSIETQEIIALIFDPNAETYGYRKQIIAENVLLPTDAQTGDFNNDGLMDVVSLSFEENVVLLHTQDIQGDFSTAIISESPMRPRKIVVDDFNNDEILDFLVASEEDNSVRLFNGIDGISFNELLVSDQLTGIRYIARCDLDEATYPDFVAGVTGLDQAILFTNLENNRFNTDVIDNNLPGASAVHCADTNDDQAVELIGLSSAAGIIYQYELQGGFNKILIANARDGYVNVSVANFSPNAQPKIVTQAFFEDRNLLLSPQTSNEEKVVWEDFPDGAYYIDYGDIDRDGDEDLIYAAFIEDKVFWAENTEPNYIIHTIFEGVDGPQSIKVFDLDEDGDLDVFSAGAWDDSFWYHQNAGQGQFTTHLISDTANNAARIDFMDVNGDKKIDVVGTSSLDDSLRWFDRIGVQFTEFLIDDQLDGALALEIGDIDLDGNQDIIVGSFFGNTITAFVNNGKNGFFKQSLSNSKIKPTTILLANIDNDLSQEIIFNTSQDGVVWVLDDSMEEYKEIIAHDRGEKTTSFIVYDNYQSGPINIVDISDKNGDIFSSNKTNANNFTSRTIRKGQFGARSIVSLQSKQDLNYRFALASNIDNSIKILTLTDSIYESGFEKQHL